MKILEKIKVPTGEILIVNGNHGKLEMLSLADYGKDINLNQHKKVSHTKLMPLTKKWVLTISTQYGCSMGCKFCDVPKVGMGINATYDDLISQVDVGLDLHPDLRTERLNIHFARMGEPTWNPSVIHCAKWLKNAVSPIHKVVHPVVSTMMPKKNKRLQKFIWDWANIKNEVFNGEAGLQLSINSTDENERKEMFNDSALCLDEISDIMTGMIPKGRKFTLNFAIANYTINPDILLKYFNPKYYCCKLTPMHKTFSAENNNIKTKGDYTESYPYEEIELKLKDSGYDVLVFIASKEEDESRITCGNAILGAHK